MDYQKIKKTIALATDEKYLSHVPYLVTAARLQGLWDGDICLICPTTTHRIVQQLQSAGVHIFSPENLGASYFTKFSLFNQYFKQWDVVLYLDLDFLILGDLRILLECNLPLLSHYRLLVDEEDASIAFTLNNPDFEVYQKLAAQLDLNKNNFNSSCLIYRTDWINAAVCDQLLQLTQHYAPINHHTGAEHGTDQPILNIFFYGQWGQIKRVSYYTAILPDTLAAHTMRWRAPWSHYVPLYRRNTQLFHLQADTITRPVVEIVAPVQLDGECMRFLQDTAAWRVKVAPVQHEPSGDTQFTLLMAHPFYLSPLWDMLLTEPLHDGTICTIPLDSDDSAAHAKKLCRRQKLLRNLLKLGHSLFVHQSSLIRGIMLRLFLRKLAQRFTNWCERKLAADHYPLADGMSPSVCMVNTAWLHQLAQSRGKPIRSLTAESVIESVPSQQVKSVKVFSSSARKLIVDMYIPAVWREPHLYEHLRVTGLKNQPGLYELDCATSKNSETVEPLSPAQENP